MILTPRKTKKSKLDPFQAEMVQWFGTENIKLSEAQNRLLDRGLKVSAAAISEWWANHRWRTIEKGLQGRSLEYFKKEMGDRLSSLILDLVALLETKPKIERLAMVRNVVSVVSKEASPATLERVYNSLFKCLSNAL
jgi:hypothetical protein